MLLCVQREAKAAAETKEVVACDLQPLVCRDSLDPESRPRASLSTSVVCVGSLKVAAVGVFTPWRLADATNTNLGFGVFFRLLLLSPIYQHTRGSHRESPSLPFPPGPPVPGVLGMVAHGPPACWAGFQAHRHRAGGGEGEGALAFGAPVCGRREPTAQRLEPFMYD